MRGARLAALLLLLIVVLGGGAWVLRARQVADDAGGGPALPAIIRRDETVRAPEGVRIRVQVLNTTRTRGLARRATRLLRDRGFDVVEMGTTSPLRDTTLVLDRSGHPEWAAQVARVLGPARSETRRDSSRYLDVTVLIGGLWRPPAEPFYP